MTIKELFAQMPRSEKIGMFTIPPLFLALFWALWTMTPA